jgi:hypothetical protein
MAVTDLFNRDKDTLTPKLVRERYDESVRHMRRQMYEYALNQWMLLGEQWLYFNSTTNSLAQLPRDPARTRITANRLWPGSRHLMAKLLSRPLVFEVQPGDSDDATVRGAHTSQAVLTDLHREHNWEDLREQMAWATWVGGTAVLAMDWDPKGGTTLGQLPLSGQPFGTGEITESVLTVQEVAWEPGTRDGEKGTWWLRAQALPCAEVQAMHNLDAKPDADASALQMPSSFTFTRDFRGETRPDLTLVLTYYERPNPRRPQGTVATVVGGKFVDGPHPWPFPFKDRLNMVVVRETKIPGQAHGYTVLSAAVPLQAAYNASWSNIVEHLKLVGNARLLMPEASVDLLDELSDLPGEVIPFNPSAGTPSWLAPAGLPQWVIEQPALLAAQMDDIMGVHDASRGQAPRNLESGLGLSILVEQDTTPLGKLTKELAAGFERFACLCLKTYGAKVSEPRSARIRIPGQVPEMVSWTGEALQGQYKATIPTDAIMPRSRAAMFAMAKDMVQMGLIVSPREFARIADLPDRQDFVEAIDVDVSKAGRENHLMAMGQVMLPADFDNHGAHIKEHNWFRKSARYESLDEEKRDTVDKHIKAHEVMAAEEAGTQVAKARVHPALSGAPTAHEAAPLPPEPGMLTPGLGTPAGAPVPPPEPNLMPAPSAAPPGMGPMPSPLPEERTESSR